MEQGNIVFVVNKEQPDFIGRYAGISDGLIALRQALSAEYDAASPQLGTSFMPVGAMPDLKHKVNVRLPLANVLYLVEVEEGDTLAVLYDYAMRDFEFDD